MLYDLKKLTIDDENETYEMLQVMKPAEKLKFKYINCIRR